MKKPTERKRENIQSRNEWIRKQIKSSSQSRINTNNSCFFEFNKVD